MVHDSKDVLLGMAFFLGIRHGFDLDHLATIDAMTQNLHKNQFLSRMVGFLFSLGHGCVVVGVSVLIGGGLIRDTPPHWLYGLGEGISLFFLVLFAVLTFANALKRPQQAPMFIHLKGQVVQKFFPKSLNGFWVFFIGMLFAFSFDTVSQVVLFSIAAKAQAQAFFCALMGFVFMLGMMTADGFNGLFFSALIQQVDGVSCYFSRMIGFVIAAFSLGIAVMHGQQWLMN